MTSFYVHFHVSRSYTYKVEAENEADALRLGRVWYTLDDFDDNYTDCDKRIQEEVKPLQPGDE